MNFQSFGQTVKGHSRDLDEKSKGKTEQARKVRAKPVDRNQLGVKMQLSLIKNIGERIKGPTPCLMGPLDLHRPQFQLHIFMFREKKIREKDSLRFTTRSRRQALIFLGRADLESVRGSGEGNLSPSSSSTILHHQFHDAHRRA